MSDKARFKTFVSLLAVMLSAAIITSAGLFVKPVSAASWNVTISNFAFQPQNSTVQGGDTVTWTNNDPVVHTLWFTRANDSATYLFSDPINPGATWAHLFPDVLQLKYYDFERLWMNGSLTVIPFFDFSIGNSGPTTIVEGGTAANTITINLASAITRSVTLSVSGFPPGIGFSFAGRCAGTPSCSSSPSFTTVLGVSTLDTTPTGTYTITVNATGGLQTHTTSFTLTVRSDQSVGGVMIPLDKLALLTPYIALSLTVSVISLSLVVFIRRTKRTEQRLKTNLLLSASSRMEIGNREPIFGISFGFVFLIWF